MKKTNNLIWGLLFILIGLLVSLCTSIIMIKNYDKKSLYSLNNLVFKTHAPMLTINKTGLLTMQSIDISLDLKRK